MFWVEVAGWLGAALTAGAYSMRDMKRLRYVAVGANVSFISYGFFSGVWPMFFLHLFLLPLNLYRLFEILSATRRLLDSRNDERPLSALKPFLTPVEFDQGHVLFRRGDAPDYVYVIEEGEVDLTELGMTIGSGTLFGEMAFFVPQKSRTATAVCRTRCRILVMDERKFMELFHQTPEFGVYVLRLIASRLDRDSEAHGHGDPGVPGRSLPLRESKSVAGGVQT